MLKTLRIFCNAKFSGYGDDEKVQWLRRHEKVQWLRRHEKVQWTFAVQSR